MAKFNIQITKIETGFLKSNQEIANIDVCNGNWKYWDNLMETNEKQSLTINTIQEAHYLHKPVKDAIGLHDQEAWKNNGEIIVNDAMVRTYDSLLTYLNCRINNVKEEVKSGMYRILDYDKKGGMTFNCVLFEDTDRDKDVTEDITFENKGLIEIKIKVVE